METVIGIIVGLFVLVVLVVLHELGHAIVAMRNGVVVKEFGIGFPPKAWGRKLKNGILLTLNWLPLGGFVRMKGEYDSSNKPGDYGAASYWAKTKILFAGVLINWLTAALLFTILAVTGLPKLISNQFYLSQDANVVVHNTSQALVANVLPETAAAKAGVQKGDVLTKLNGQKITQQDDLQNFMTTHYGQEVAITVQRDGQVKELQMTLPTEPGENGAISGIASAFTPERATIYATWSAPIVGVGTAVQLSWLTLDGIGKIFVSIGQTIASKFTDDPSTKLEGKYAESYISNSATGPIGIVGGIFPQIAHAGVSAVVFFAAIISLSLAVMNILPIPALDGGRWYTMSLFRLFKKKLTREREEKIQSVSMLVLFALFIVISIGDVGRIIG